MAGGYKAYLNRGHDNRIGDESNLKEFRTQRVNNNAGYSENQNMTYQNANSNFLPSIQGSQKRSGTSAKYERK